MLTEIAFDHKQDDSIKINHAFREIYCKVWCIANDIALFIANARQIGLAVTVICLSFDHNDDDVGGLFFANARCNAV